MTSSEREDTVAGTLSDVPIDSRIPHLQNLIDGAKPGEEVLVRDPSGNRQDFAQDSAAERSPCHRLASGARRGSGTQPLQDARRGANSDNPDTGRYLAAFQIRQGRFVEAAALLRDLVTAGNASAEVANDLGLALAGLGRHDEAIVEYRRAIERAPDGVAARNNLGLSLQALQRHAGAMPYFEEALALDPETVEAHANLGRSLAALDRNTDAKNCYLRALALKPDFVPAYRGLFQVLLALDDGEAALKQAELALERNPDDPDICNDLGRALAMLSRHDEAVARFETAIVLRPDFAKVHTNLGNALCALNRHKEAIASYGRALELTPDLAQAHCGLGNAFIEEGRHDEALASFDAALRIDPKFAKAHHNRGTLLETLGQLKEALACYGTAVTLAPEMPEFWHSLAQSKRFSPNDPDLPALEGLARDMSRFTERQRTALHFALAKAYDDVGRHGRAFDHLLRGNALGRKARPYREAATLAMFRRVAEVFTADLLRARHGVGDLSSAPVFIVGMPRSGTTLIEQILASHPNVHGAGELSDVHAAARAMHWDDGRRAYPDIVPSLSDDELRRLGAGYREKAHAVAPWAERVTDKLPENFVFLGLVHLALPNARFIHARRDPADTCLSCFFKLFTSQPHTFDLAELGRYYCAYDALMAHWRDVLPAGVMIDMQYEDLITDFEPQARRLLAHCGLPWDDRCLSFHATKRPVRTASVTQVRRPLYASSVGRWRPYRRLLAPLFDELSALTPASARMP